jgi:phosphatidate cytidylyltransferase
MKRLLTAAALIPAVVYVVLFAPFWVFLAVVMTVAILSYYEYDSVAAAYGFGAPGPMGYGFGLALLAWQGEPWLIFLAAAIVALVMTMRGELAKALPRASLLLMGVVYVFGGWKCALPLHEANPHWLMYALLISWSGDAGAYYIGRAFGKHKLAPRVSPNKSWEGSAASVAASALVAGAYLLRFVPEVTMLQAAAITVAANAAGQLGDLAESAMKRGAGVKDSGALLPGHGGFLDRVDSTLFTLPVIYVCLKILG